MFIVWPYCRLFGFFMEGGGFRVRCYIGKVARYNRALQVSITFRWCGGEFEFFVRFQVL